MTNKYKIVIKGNGSYLLDKIIKEDIFIYNIDKYKDKLILVIDEVGYKKIRKKYNIIILNRYGNIKIKYLFNKYSIFIYAVIIGIFINIILSNMIFNIDIIHSNKYIKNIIYKDLKLYGIRKYNFKKSYKEKELIKEKILKKEVNYIEWLEIEEVGTKYIIRVEQRKKKYKTKKCPLQNIIAKKNAMILDIDAIEGEVVKKKYDYVSKGDVIISGLIHNKEKIVSKSCATGKIYGEIWYNVEVELPSNYYEKKYTSRSRNVFEISFLNKNYPLFNTYKYYSIDRNILFKSNILPISFNISKYKELKLIKTKYNGENINSKAIQLAENKLNKKLSKGDKIITKKVLKKYRKDSKIIVDIFFKVKEDITDTNSISNIDIDLENSKISEE